MAYPNSVGPEKKSKKNRNNFAHAQSIDAAAESGKGQAKKKKVEI